MQRLSEVEDSVTGEALRQALKQRYGFSDWEANSVIASLDAETLVKQGRVESTGYR